MSPVFTKTAKGQEEMTSRAGGLTPRQRRILIMIDGKRSVEDIRAMALADDLSHTLGLLEESAFIELLKPPEQAAPGGVSGDVQEFFNTFREIPEPPNPKDLEQAKNFIMNTLKTFCGPWVHLSIVEAAFAAKTHAEMREQFAPWYAAIVETRDGRRRAEELRNQLLKVI